MGLHVERKVEPVVSAELTGPTLIRLDKDNNATTKRGSELHTK
jgi:hypothetical protein